MRFVLSAILIAGQIGLLAQDPVDEVWNVPGNALKVSPAHLVNFYPTIELSYEQRIRPRLTTQVEAGYVLDTKMFRSERYQDKRGVKIKLEARHYFMWRSADHIIYYGAVESYMNIINFDRSEVVLECFDLECMHQYTRRYYDKVRYREHGASFKIGFLHYLGSKTFIDFNGGFTLRNIRYEKPPRPRQADQFAFEDSFGTIDESARIAMAPALGLRFGYRFK